MKIEQFRKIAEKFKSNEVYDIFDYKGLQNLMVSVTDLKPMQNTTGHSHDDADEVYVGLEGYGEIQVADNIFDFNYGDVVVIPRGAFHKVWNKHDTRPLSFICIFEKYGERK
jgi:mannose-6-phosphate isomerase-like protein (cupin superfamily)